MRRNEEWRPETASASPATIILVWWKCWRDGLGIDHPDAGDEEQQEPNRGETHAPV